MRTNILQKYSASPLRVYVVWFDMLAGDSRDRVDREVLNDRRATNYFDSKRVAGAWFAEHVDHRPGVAWDTYFLYPADATWNTEPGPLLSSGSSVIGSSGDLALAFKRLAA